MKKSLLVIASLLLIIQVAHPNQYKEFVSKESPNREIIRNNQEVLELSYSFPGFSFDSVSINNRWYKIPHIKDFTHLKAVGKPALPSHTDLVAIADKKNYTIEILNTEYTEIHGIQIAPARPPLRDTYGVEDPNYKLDKTFYNTDKFYPEKIARISGIQNYRSLAMGSLQVTPFQYNPVQKVLKFYTEITYRVTFNNKEGFIKANDLSGNFKKMAPNLVLNNQVLKRDIKAKTVKTRKSQTSVDYIMLTHTKYREAAENLATWKRQTGQNVELIVKENWLPSDVKSTIHSLYDTSVPRPDYFLIIGDHEDVPGEIHYSPDDESFSSDLYYACMNGPYDYTPDMAHGRLSVSTAEEAEIVVNKIISYESSPPQDDAFYQQGTNCAQFQDDELNGYATRRFAHTSEDIRNYMMEQDFDVERIYYTDPNVTPTNYNNGWYSNGEPIPDELLRDNGFQWNGGQDDIINAINDGRFYLFHRDHGYAGGSGWAHPYFVKSSIDYLENGPQLPVVFSINCHTGEFLLPNSFAEKFMRHPQGGAVGVFAASYYSYSGYNDGLSSGFIDAMFPDPGLIPEFGDGGIDNPNITPHEKIMTMGDVLNQGLIRMGETWGSNRYTNEIFHYFGDPAMKLRTSFEGEITANNPDTIFYESQSEVVLTDCSVSNSVATVVSNEKLLDSMMVENESATLTFDSLTGDYLLLTISKDNHKPYIDTIYIAGRPKATFDVTEYNSCDGEVAFTNHSYFNAEEYTWIFGDGDTSHTENPHHEYTSNGEFQVKLVATNTFGSDTSILQEPVIIERPSAPEVKNDTICKNETARFVSLNEDGIIQWYNPDSTLIQQGSAYLTDSLTETSSFLVSRKTLASSYVGKKDDSGEAETGHNFMGLNFEAHQDFLLQSVKVYADGEGDRVIQLRDNSYNVLKSDTLFIENGAHRISLNWQVEGGMEYKLVAQEDHSLMINTTGFAYPYEHGEILNITESTFIPDPTSKYYCFYDWEVRSYTCKSPMKEIKAIVHQPVNSDFQVTIGDPDISIENLSENAQHYYWDFGDGTTSEEISPQHTYAENGEYDIRLISENFCGKDTSAQTVEIKTVGTDELGWSDWDLYPNPTKGVVVLKRRANTNKPATIYIRDVSGRITGKLDLPKNKQETKIDFSDFEKGVYLLEIRTTEQTHILKIIRN